MRTGDRVRCEYAWGLGVIKEVLSEIMKECPEQKSSIENIFNEVHLNVFQRTMVFCFSEEGDLLSQWRGYGCDGSGFAIGFDSKKMSEIFNLRDISISTLNFDNSFSLSKVIYGKDEQTRRIKEDILSRIDVELKLAHLCRILKNTAFHEEKEWRVIHIPIEFMLDVSGKVDFKEFGNKIIPYVAMNFREHKDIIKEIWIGPANPNGTYDQNDGEIKLFLKKCGFSHDIEVRKSKATYCKR